MFYSNISQQWVAIPWGLEKGFKSVFKLRFSESFHLCPGHQHCLKEQYEEQEEKVPMESVCVQPEREITRQEKCPPFHTAPHPVATKLLC